MSFYFWKNKKFFHRLKHKHRLVILQDDTLEENFSFKLTPLNVFIAVGISGIVLIFATTFIIAFTPLREYIPGYADVKLSKNIRKLSYSVDSLETRLKQKEDYFNNLKTILIGNIHTDSLPTKPDVPVKTQEVPALNKSKEDSMLRGEFENSDEYNLLFTEEKKSNITSISSFFFFTPLRGYVVNNFNLKKGHYGIDIVAKENEAIKATLDGTVIFSSWTLETGYVIGLQHTGNIVSIYKHNSALMKKQGDFVKAGDVIAIIGNTGELSTGPHLHFELWYNGSPVNPKDYITF